MMCAMCSVGYHSTCFDPGCVCNQQGHSISGGVTTVNPTTPKEVDEDSIDGSSDGRRYSGRDTGTRLVSGRANKRDALLKDQQSTGRKRAARMYPLTPNTPCEWKDKANCGGGKHPIVGCLQGVQEARHHGPDKNVTNNEEGNVHRICHSCHYRWHRANDGTYDWNETVVNSHAPVPMTDADKDVSIEAFLKFKTNKAKRIKD